MVKPKYRINVFSVKSLFEGALNVKSGKETPLNIDAEWTIESLIARKEMGENSLFYQICRHKLEQQYANDLTRVENEIQNLRSSNLEASEFIVGDLIYLNFEGVFDDVGNLIDESNAPLLMALFEQGIIIDFNNQKTHYLSFEKSNGMSKNKILSFIRKEYKNPIHERIMMGIPLDSQNFVLNKLFAYNGLMLSDGYRIDGLKRRDESDVAFNEDSIVLISDVTKYQKADYKTVFNFQSIEELVKEILYLLRYITEPRYDDLRMELEKAGDREPSDKDILDNSKKLFVRKKRILRDHIKTYFIVQKSERIEDSQAIINRIDEAINEVFLPFEVGGIKADEKGNYLHTKACESIFSRLELSLTDQQKKQWQLVTIKNGTRELNLFDGVGLISPHYAKQINTAYSKIRDGEKLQHTSFQIRMPFVKGMVHQVDFKQFALDKGTTVIIDAFGIARDICKIEMIITISQFKAYGWFMELFKNMNIADKKRYVNQTGKVDIMKYYFEHFNRYNHALYITNSNKILTKTTNYTKLNYQFLSTVDIDKKTFLELLEPSIEQYIKIKRDPQTQKNLFLSTDSISEFAENIDDESDFEIADYTFYQKAEHLLNKNINALQMKALKSKIDEAAKKQLDDFAVGKIIIEGENRYLSGDLLFLLYYMIGKKDYFNYEKNKNLTEEELEKIESIRLSNRHFYAPKVGKVSQFKHNHPYVLLRNPHIIRNEDGLLTSWDIDDPNNERVRYLGHLKGLVMVNASLLISERLGGADYDGDMIKIISDQRYIDAVSKHYYVDSRHIKPHQDNLTVVIPKTSSPRKPYNSKNVLDCIKSTFSNRVGSISNEAFMYANVCYNSSYQVEKPHSLKNLLELYLITIGLEIDSAKSGDKPPLPDTTVVDEMLKKAGLEKPKESEAAAFIRYKDGFKEYRGNVNKYQYKDIFNGLSNKEMIEQYLSKGSNSNLTILPYIFHLLIPEMVRTEINRFESEYDIFIGMIKNYTAKYQQSDTTHSLFKFDKDDKYFKTFEKSGTKDINKLRNLLTLVDAYKDVRLKLDQYEYVIQDKFDQNSLKKDRGIIDEYIGSILFIQYGHKHYNDIADIGTYLSTLDVEQLKDLLNQIVRLNWSFLEYVSQETKDKILKETLIDVEGETAKKMYDLLSNFKFKGSRLFYLFLLKAKRMKTFKENSSEYQGEKIEKLTRNLMRALEDFTFEETETIARDIFDFYQTLASNIYTNFPNVNALLDDEQLKKRFLSFSDSLSAYFKEWYDSGDISLNENASFCEINQKFALLVGNDNDSSTYLETIISQSSLENVFEEHTGVKLDFTTQDYVPVKDALRELMKAAFSYSEPPEDIRDRFVRSDLTIKREYFVKLKPDFEKVFKNVKEKTSVKPLIVELNDLMYRLINDLFSDSKEEALEYFYYLTRKSSHSNIVKQKYLFDLMFQDLYNYMVCGGSAHD